MYNVYKVKYIEDINMNLSSTHTHIRKAKKVYFKYK